MLNIPASAVPAVSAVRYLALPDPADAFLAELKVKMDKELISGPDLEAFIQEHPAELKQLEASYPNSPHLLYAKAITLKDSDPALLPLLEKTASAGLFRASISLSCFLYHGLGCKEDRPRAQQLAKAYFPKLKELAFQKHIFAIATLGLCFRWGLGTPRDTPAALHYLALAAQMGDIESMTHLGICLLAEDKSPSGYKVAVQSLMKAAQLGDPVAMFELGVCFEDGTGVKKSLKEAASWYKQSAKKGNVRAMNNLAACYFEGTGVNVNPEKGFGLLCTAAESGLVEALFSLAECYMDGQGVARDVQQALHYYRLAAEKGDTSAMQGLGDTYALGADGVQPDQELAIPWYLAAVNAGHTEVLPDLATAFLEVDSSQAFYWFVRTFDHNVSIIPALTICELFLEHRDLLLAEEKLNAIPNFKKALRFLKKLHAEDPDAFSIEELDAFRNLMAAFRDPFVFGNV